MLREIKEMLLEEFYCQFCFFFLITELVGAHFRKRRKTKEKIIAYLVLNCGFLSYTVTILLSLKPL